MHTLKRLTILGLMGLLLLSSCAKSFAAERDFSTYFAERGVVGSFLLYDESQNHFIRDCPNRCAEQFIPASTFKLLTAQIALETGVIENENEVIPWDGTDWGRQLASRS